eukprot:3140458-Prymnesium_polylepis.1
MAHLAAALEQLAEAEAAQAAASGPRAVADAAERVYEASAHAYRQESAMGGLVTALQWLALHG